MNLNVNRTDDTTEDETFDANTTTVDGVETINFSTSGSNPTDADTTAVTAQLDGDAATAVNISGSNELALTIGDVAGDEVTVDASEATGDVALSISAAEAAGVTGGFTGGQSGSDSLTITGVDTETVELQSSAFETVGATFDDQATGEVQVDRVSDVDTIALTLNGTQTDAGVAGAQVMTVSGISDGLTVTIDGSPGDNTDAGNGGAGASANELVLEGAGSTSSLTAALNTANDFETTGGSDLAVNRAGTVTVDVADAADTAQSINNLTLGTAEDLVLTGGDSDLTITTATAGDLETITSTGLTSGSTLQLGDGTGNATEFIGSALNYELGDHGFGINLETAAAARDTVSFDGSDITSGSIANFDGGLGGDILDFSAFESISGIGDLTLADVNGNNDLEIDSDAFDGTVTLV
ncbi:hypothetical protein, partial [Spiribacter roseus]|uniref:hypothetical protein n=1 Tax=Spiribacter roseus TaxID=1855875 RepID=UPI00132F7158